MQTLTKEQEEYLVQEFGDMHFEKWETIEAKAQLNQDAGELEELGLDLGDVAAFMLSIEEGHRCCMCGKNENLMAGTPDTTCDVCYDYDGKGN